MLVRLGYVAMTMNLKDCSPSGTVTVKTLSNLPDEETRLYRLRKITKENLKNTLRILRYNKAYNINVYRLTSKLVPLATHPAAEGWDYAREFKDEFREIGDFVKENDFRVSAHPDHYTVINTNSDRVWEASIKDLDYHVRLFEAMGLEDFKYKLVLHIGGVYGDKQSSIERFIASFRKLPERIAKRLVLENDDKTYTALEVLNICKELKVPMVVDVHHHNCINNGEELKKLLPEIFSTWDNEYFVPKVHFSSPKSSNEFRSHAEDINVDEFYEFLKASANTGRDFDVMLEAKNKDTALFNLSRGLKTLEGIKWIDEGHFEFV